MKYGPKRFDFFLNQLQELLTASSKQKNPALWLYQNDARTPLFMLEGLSKIYAGIHDKKEFRKLDLQFKLSEDVLGAIDYYDSFAKEFAKNKKIPVAVTRYLQAQTREKIQQLNEILIEKKWVGGNKNRIAVIRKKLAKTDWLKEKEEIKSIAEFYHQTIAEITAFTGRSNFHFTNIESDVHELRRKLRWLSIYPQAVKGSIQLSRAAKAPKYLAKYLTKEITRSPFNVMPDAGDCKHILLLEKNYYLALSWMISELGKIKDNGLRIIATREALKQTGNLSDAAALKKAYSLGGRGQLTLKNLLDKADTVCKTYFREKDLQKLVHGITSNK